jgi:hypothetical protein
MKQRPSRWFFSSFIAHRSSFSGWQSFIVPRPISLDAGGSFEDHVQLREGAAEAMQSGFAQANRGGVPSIKLSRRLDLAKG